MQNSHRRSIKLFRPFPGQEPPMYRRSRSVHTLCSCPRAERPDLVYGFSAVLAFRQVGTHAPLSPSPGLSRRAETALLNKSVEISTTAGRFCSRCRLYARGFPRGMDKIAYSPPRFPEKKLRTQKTRPAEFHSVRIPRHSGARRRRTPQRKRTCRRTSGVWRQSDNST